MFSTGNISNLNKIEPFSSVSLERKSIVSRMTGPRTPATVRHERLCKNFLILPSLWNEPNDISIALYTCYSFPFSRHNIVPVEQKEILEYSSADCTYRHQYWEICKQNKPLSHSKAITTILGTYCLNDALKRYVLSLQAFRVTSAKGERLVTSAKREGPREEKIIMRSLPPLRAHWFFSRETSGYEADTCLLISRIYWISICLLERNCLSVKERVGKLIRGSTCT